MPTKAKTTTYGTRADTRLIARERARDTALDTYLREIAGHPLLDARQEQTMARAVQSGDRAARDRFITANLRFVVGIASRYSDKGAPLADLIGAGNVGLIRAVDRYQPGTASRFANYASYWIRQACARLLSERAELPDYLYQARLTVWRVEQDAERDGHALDDATIAQRAGVTPARLRAIRTLRVAPLSLDIAMAADGDGEPLMLAEVIAAPNDQADAARDATLARHLAALPKAMATALSQRERLVLSCRYGLGGVAPMSQAATAELLARVAPPKTSRTAIRKIERQAIATLAAVFIGPVDILAVLRLAQDTAV